MSAASSKRIEEEAERAKMRIGKPIHSTQHTHIYTYKLHCKR